MSFDHIPPFDPESGDVNVIVDTPKGSRNKYAFDVELGLFLFKNVLTTGHYFPYNFGYIPGTLAGDGDPLDVLIIMDEAVFTGCLVRCRLIGVIEAEQTELSGETMRNDRLIAVASKSVAHDHIRSLGDLGDPLVKQIEHFFVSYNEAKGKKFVPLARSSADNARELIKDSEQHGNPPPTTV